MPDPGDGSQGWIPDLGNGHFQGFSGILPGLVPSQEQLLGQDTEQQGWRKTGKVWERLPTIPSCSHLTAPEAHTWEIPSLLHPGFPASNPSGMRRFLMDGTILSPLGPAGIQHIPADPGGWWIPGILPHSESRAMGIARSNPWILERSWGPSQATITQIQDPGSGARDSRWFGEKENPGRQGTARPNPTGNTTDSPKDIWSWDESSWAQGPRNDPWDGRRGKFGMPGMCQG